MKTGPQPTIRGNLRLSINWPGRAVYVDNSRIIPEQAERITISITGDGIASPVQHEIPCGQSSVIIENLPSGSKTALIRAVDDSDQILSQSKKAFSIKPGETTDSGAINLGFVITNTPENPVFEPSSIVVEPGSTLYIQNWLNTEETCNVNGGDHGLNAAAGFNIHEK